MRAEPGAERRCRGQVSFASRGPNSVHNQGRTGDESFQACRGWPDASAGLAFGAEPAVLAATPRLADVAGAK
jgi:hypothetical protein